MSLPTRLRDARRLIETLDLRQIEAAVAQEAQARLVLIGPVNSGKSTLFNQLKGQRMSPVSAVPGTTREAFAEQFGPFVLVDTPGFGEAGGADRSDAALRALGQADVAVLVLDASAGIRQDDVDLYQQSRALGLSTVVVLNKIDLIKEQIDEVVHDAERKLGAPLIPISAKRGTNVASDLIPAVIDADPRMAVTIGRALPRFRQMAARRIIRESSVLAGLVGAEPIPALSIPLLIAIQVRMLLRLSAIFGEDLTAARARELLSAIVGGVAIRYGAQELAKLVPGVGWLAAGLASATGTTALGNAAIAFFEKKLSPAQLRALYRRMRWRLKPGQVTDAENDVQQV